MRIPQGLSVGVIGRNGSGKSSLLKLITGIYKPDKGSVSINGKVAALIELGAGFHPDFTGRENLHLGGIIHGLTKEEIDQRFDKIVKFAELEDVIDDPVRTYSSGMFMRLGFSLAVHTDPDVLLIDEVLAVGDEAFIHKCKDKVSALRKEGKTLLIVSHDLAAVERWSDEVLWLHNGKVKDRGSPRRVIDHYREFLEKQEEKELVEEREEMQEEQVQEETDQERWGSREVEIINVSLKDKDNNEHLIFHPDQEVVVEFDFKFNEETEDVVFGVGINKSDGLVVFGTNTDIEKVELPNILKSKKVKFTIKRLSLLEGEYFLDIAVHRKDGYPYDYHKSAVKFKVRNNFPQVGVLLPEHEWEVC
ncbi:UNVERIFIED_CONTAM: hypothetical protein GTU68_051089 [Idotea baltica]|nr:hypothetical protein [Idotea baltica]